MGIFTITKVILRFLFGKPATQRYPFAKKTYCDNSRGCITIEIKDCIFCGICQRKCPTKAITVDKDKKIWTIDRLCCITCGACVEACPKKCLRMDNQYTEPALKRTQETHTNAV